MSLRRINPSAMRRKHRFLRLAERVVRSASGCLIQGTHYLRFAPIYDECLQKDPSAFRREPRARE